MTQFLAPKEWFATAFQAFDARPVPRQYLDVLLPTFDVMGASRLPEAEFEEIQGALGGIEVFHDAVGGTRWRKYLAVAYSHDDAAARILTPGVIVRTATGFPFQAFRDGVSVPSGQSLVLRSLPVGPTHQAAVRADAMAAGARITAQLFWVDLPVGEYTQDLSAG